jgi:hypothetical protein
MVQERDGAISFDEPSHTYTVADVVGTFVSVTGLLHEHFHPFKGNIIATAMAKSENLHKNAAYAEIAKIVSIPVRKKMIQRQWAQTAVLGTDMHAYAEERLNRNYTVVEDANESAPIEYHYLSAYLNSLVDIGMIPWGIEKRLWDAIAMLAGSVDYIGRTPDGRYHLKDWKRSGNISSIGKGRGTSAHTRHLKDCNLMHYYIQLNLYKYLLETYYGITVDSMEIVNFHPNNNGYMVYAVPVLAKVIAGIINDRTAQVKRQKQTIVTKSSKTHKLSSGRQPCTVRTLVEMPRTADVVAVPKMLRSKRKMAPAHGGQSGSNKVQIRDHGDMLEEPGTAAAVSAPATLQAKRTIIRDRSGKWISKKIPHGYHDVIIEGQDKRRKRNNPKLHEFNSELEILSYIMHRNRLDMRNTSQSGNVTHSDVIVDAEQKMVFLKRHLVAMWRLLGDRETNNNAIRNYMRVNRIQNDYRLNPSIRYMYDSDDESNNDEARFRIEDISGPVYITDKETSYIREQYNA